MTVSTASYTTIIGAVIGLVWSFALKFSFKYALFFGGIGGLLLGLLLSYFQYQVAKRDNIQKGEVGFVTGSMLGLLIWIGIGTGLVAWIIRAVFF